MRRRQHNLKSRRVVLPPTRKLVEKPDDRHNVGTKDFGADNVVKEEVLKK